MQGAETPRTVKRIRVDVAKCTGCRTCEMACSAVHSLPPHSGVNPARSRIAVVMDEAEDVFLPVRAGVYTGAECAGRNRYVIEGKEYSDCSFCPASCPSRDSFREPDSGLPLRCDLCEGLSLPEPACVQVCHPGALSYEESRDEPGDAPEAARGEIEDGLASLIDRFGATSVVRTAARMAKGRRPTVGESE